MMKWELFEKILGDLKEFSGAVKVINLYGFGEPLLNPRLADMVSELKRNHISREVRITTNGSYLTPTVSEKLINAGIDIVRVSVEALTEEDYKTICESPVTFETICNNIANFFQLSRGTKSKISAKIVSAALRNQSDLERFHELFGAITDFHFIEQIEDYWPEFIQKSGSADMIEAERKCYIEGEVRKICTFPFTDMTIQANGDVTVCCVDWKAANKYGNVKYDSLKDLWLGDTLKSIQCMHLDYSAYSKTVCKYCKRKTNDQIDGSSETLKLKILGLSGTGT